MKTCVPLRSASVSLRVEGGARSAAARFVHAKGASVRCAVPPPALVRGWRHAGRSGRVRADAGEGAPEKAPFGVLETGTVVVVTELPPFVKTSNNIPAMRDASKVISVGEVGRILDRKPKGVWVVRFKSGAYMIDERYLELLEPAEEPASDAR